MRTKDIVKKHGIDGAVFERWLKQSGYSFKSGMMGGLDLSESENVDEVVLAFKQHLVSEKERTAREMSERDRAAALEQAAAARKQQGLTDMMVTTGFGFEGYSIIRYSGYISGDDAVQVDRGTSGVFARATDVGASLMSSLGGIRQNALTELKEAAYALGCNAIIGVDFDYLTLDPETASSSGGVMYLPYVFGVTANGTAVVIEQSAGS